MLENKSGKTKKAKIDFIKEEVANIARSKNTKKEHCEKKILIFNKNENDKAKIMKMVS